MGFNSGFKGLTRKHAP